MGEIVALFGRGGPLMWVLLFLLAATIAILLDRGLYFLATSLPRNASAEHWERRLGSYPGLPESGAKLMEDLESSLRSYERRAFFLWKENEPLSMARFLLEHPGVRAAEVRRYGEDLIWRMNRRTPALATVSQLSPLVGLLGTIIGMILAFSTISATESPSMASLATGIWEALITTAAGLIVAIPAQAGHAILERQAARRIHLMNSISGLFLVKAAGEGE